MLVVVALGLLFLKAHKQYRPPAWVYNVPPLSIAKHADTGMLKVAWATLQIVSTVSWNLNVRFPKPFSHMLYALGLLQFDFLSLDCVSGEANYYYRVVALSLSPILLALANFAALILRLAGIVGKRAARSGAYDCARVSLSWFAQSLVMFRFKALSIF